MKLLTIGNTKTLKGQTIGYQTWILHLAPHKLSGYNTCPMASAGCAASCLNTAGRGGMIAVGETTNAIQRARISKTIRFFQDRAGFMADLVKDITAAIRKSTAAGFIPVFRLNGTSDIRWENVPVNGAPNVMTLFPSVQFYDYTKIANRRDLPPNYSLTFSRSESNEADILTAIQHGMNVAAVLRNGPAKVKVVKTLEEQLRDKAKREAAMAKRDPARPKVSRPRKVDLSWFPQHLFGLPVISGMEHDLRFLDPKGVIVGLEAKGEAKYDTTGFVVSV
jgi:hypothetical protein